MKVCPKCHQADFALETRTIIAGLGKDSEVQVSGIGTVEKCQTQGCEYVSVPYNFRTGPKLEIEVHAPPPPPEQEKKGGRKKKSGGKPNAKKRKGRAKKAA